MSTSIVFLLALIVICFFQIKFLRKRINILEKLMVNCLLEQQNNYKSNKEIQTKETEEDFATEITPQTIVTCPVTTKDSDMHSQTNCIEDESIQLFKAQTQTTENVISTPIKYDQTQESQPKETTIQQKNNPFHFFGVKLSAWIAGFAAVLGSFYLVKYSLDSGLLSPAIRMILSTIAAFACLFAGFICYNNKNMPNGKRIGQTLLGIGMASFYFIAYALSKLYYFIPESLSFVLMCLTTILCFASSLRFGVLIAFLGAMGGFLTPLISSTEATSSFWISTYLSVLSLSILILAYRLESFALSTFSIIASYIWIIFWTCYSYSPYDSVWFFILLAIQLAYLCFYLLRNVSFKKQWEILCHISITGLFGFCYLFLFITNFGITEWVLLLFSSIFVVTLGCFNPQKYGIHTLIHFILSLLFIFIWNSDNTSTKAIILSAFALTYFIPTFCSYWSSRKTLLFPFFYIGMPIFLIGCYFTFEAIYVALCGLIITTIMLLPLISSIQNKNTNLSGRLVLSITAMITSAMAFLLNTEYWSLVLITELLIYVGLNNLQKFDYLKFGQYILFALYFLCSYKFIRIGLWVLLVGSDPFMYEELFSTGLPSFNFWLSYIILPIITYTVLRKSIPTGKLKTAISYLLGFTIITSVTFGYSSILETIKSVTHPGYNIQMLMLSIGQIALITNMLFLISSLAYYFKKTGLAKPLFVISCIRLGCETIMMVEHDLIETSHIFWVFGIPLIAFIVNTIIAERKNQLIIWNVIYSFAFTTMVIHYLFNNANSHTELIGYSIGWFVLGLIWLFSGLYQKIMLKPAFVLIYIVVAKVFIWDISSATTLIRILALFCLAGCMLGLSWLYAKIYKVSE